MSRKPKCHACAHPLTTTLTAELAAGVPMRKLAVMYGLSAAALCRHQAHAQRGASKGAPRPRGRALDAQEPPTAQHDHRGHHIQRGTVVHLEDDSSLEHLERVAHSGTSVEPADNPRLPRFLKRMQARTANVRDRDLGRAAADAERLEQYVRDLGAPLREAIPPGAVDGVVVSEGTIGMYADVYAPIYNREEDDDYSLRRLI